MKNTFFLALLAFSLHTSLFSQGTQPCLPEGIVFGTQASIDNFTNDYPGCNAIIGDLTILGDDIVFLNGLDVIQSVGGDLVITAATSLQRLEGLTLDSVFGDFAIASNPSLQTIEALD